MKYYFITVMEHIGFKDDNNSYIAYFGDKRTWGFYSSFEDADNVIRNNVTDIHEGCYDYAVIEEYEEGISGYTGECWWYEYNWNLYCYESIKNPDILIGSFALG